MRKTSMRIAFEDALQMASFKSSPLNIIVAESLKRGAGIIKHKRRVRG